MRWQIVCLIGMIWLTGIDVIWGQSILSQKEWILQKKMPDHLKRNSPSKQKTHSDFIKKIKDSRYNDLTEEEKAILQDQIFQEIHERLKQSPANAWEEFQSAHVIFKAEIAQALKIEILYHLRELESSELLAIRFMKEFAESRHWGTVYYFYNKARFAQKKLLDKNPLSLNKTLSEHVPSDYQTEMLRMLSQEALSLGNPLAAISYLIQEMEKPHTLRSSTSMEVLEIMEDIHRLEEFEALKETYGHLPFIQKELPYLRLRLLFETQQYTQALQLIDELLPIVQSNEQKDHLEMLLNIQQQIQVALTVNPKRIGLILPLSSNNATIAPLVREVLEGIRLALLSFAARPTSGQSTLQKAAQTKESLLSESIEIVLRDSYLNAGKTQQSVRELIEDEHVVAIIGPLIRKTSEAAAVEAMRWQVPLISLSVTPSIPDMGNFIFRNNKSWQQEIETLVQYAIDYQYARRFVILYPRNREGELKMSYFWDHVERLGQTIYNVEAYDEQQRSFVKEFDEFTGRNRYISPKNRELMKEVDEKPVRIRDFDALFISLGARNFRDLPVILPYLGVYGMESTVLLGDNGWNNPSLMYYGDKIASPPIIADDYFKQSSEKPMKEFLKLHERYFYRYLNYSGPSSYTAYAYDTLGLLIQLLKEKQHHTHAALQKALLSMVPYPGVTGEIRFAKNGEAARSIQLKKLQSLKLRSLY